MTKIPDIVKQLREEEKVGLFNFNSNSELEQIMPGEANESMQEEIYSSMDESFDDKSNKDLSESFDLIEEDINLILNEISDMVMYIDNKGRIIKINNAGLGFSGFKKEEVIGKYFWTLPGVLSKKNIPKYMKVFKDTLKGKKSKDFIADLKDKSGNKHIMNWSVYPKIVYGKVDYIMIIARDITKKKELESIAYMDQELLLNLMHNTTDYIYFKDKDSKYIKLNKSTAKALCGSEDVSKVIGKSDFDFFPDIAKKILAQEKKIMKTDIPQVNEEMKATFADGNKHWVSVTKIPFKDKNGRVTGIIGISRDITEKKKKEKDIKESEKKYRNLVENLNEGIWQIDKDGYTVFVNNKLIKILGYSNKEIIGEHFFGFMDEQFVEIAKEKLNKKIGKKDSFELEFLKKNNKKIHCNVNISPIYEDEKYMAFLSLKYSYQNN